MEKMVYANGITTNFDYDDRYRVKDINAISVMHDAYNYDGVGNVTSIIGNHSRSMSYDNVDRLTGASGVWGSLSFTYSPVGNRMTRTLNSSTTNFNYSSVTNRLTSISGAESESFNYDANGNMTSVRGRVLGYNPLNQLISATLSNACCVEYNYDGDGKRIKKIDQPMGKTTVYHYGLAGNVLAETNTSGVPESEYLYINGQHVAKVTGGGFNPPIVDTDGDGIPDDYEITHGLNPNDPLDAQYDPDGDGFTNLEEYEAGSDPNNPDSNPISLQLAAWLVPVISLILN